jgi:hypothetical protein
MGSVEKRIEVLEGRLGTNYEDEQAKRKRIEEKRAEILEKIQRVLEQEGKDNDLHPRRLALLQELEEHVQRRRRGGA